MDKLKILSYNITYINDISEFSDVDDLINNYDFIGLQENINIDITWTNLKENINKINLDFILNYNISTSISNKGFGVITLFNNYKYSLLEKILDKNEDNYIIELLIFRENIIFINIININLSHEDIKYKIILLLNKAKIFIENESNLLIPTTYTSPNRYKFTETEKNHFTEILLNFDNYRIIIVGNFNNKIDTNFLNFDIISNPDIHKTFNNLFFYKMDLSDMDNKNTCYNYILDSYNNEFIFYTKKNDDNNYNPVFAILSMREFNCTKLRNNILDIKIIQDLFLSFFKQICECLYRYNYIILTETNIIEEKHFNVKTKDISLINYMNIDEIILLIYENENDKPYFNYIKNLIDNFYFYKTLTLLELFIIQNYLYNVNLLSDIINSLDRKLLFSYSALNKYGYSSLGLYTTDKDIISDKINLPYILNIINNIIRKSPKLEKSIILNRKLFFKTESTFNLLKQTLIKKKFKWIIPSIQSMSLLTNYANFGEYCIEIYVKINEKTPLLNLNFINNESEFLLGAGYVFETFDTIKDELYKLSLYLISINSQSTFIRTYNNKNYYQDKIIDNDIVEEFNLITTTIEEQTNEFKQKYFEYINRINNSENKLRSIDNLWFKKYKKYKIKYIKLKKLLT